MNSRESSQHSPQPSRSGSVAVANVASGRVKFLAIVAVMLAMELAVFDMSLTAWIRLFLTCGLLFATWVGHGWARVVLVVGFCLGVALAAVLLIGSSALERSQATLKFALLGFSVVEVDSAAKSSGVFAGRC